MQLNLAKPTVTCRVRVFQAAKNARAAPRRPIVRVAAAPVATDAPAASPAALRKFMQEKLGWEEAWVDTIVGEIKKRGLPATPAKVEAAVQFLQGLGIPSASVCNMASISKDFLLADASQMQPVIDYIQRQGVTGKAFVSLLEVNPGLLTYTVSADGKVLEKGRARASVEVGTGSDGAKLAGVSYWREGAAFETAPVAPLKPHGI